MKSIALIPARIGATRFPDKMLAPIRGKSVILRTYESTVNTGLFDQVIVITDSDRIMEEIESNGGRALKSRGEYESGTDRIAEVARYLDADVFVNVQGDTPFVQKRPLEDLLNVFKGEEGQQVHVASMVQVLTDADQVVDHNFVKVALGLNNNALFFSRSVIPYHRDKQAAVTYYEHIGVYAFRKQALLDFTSWPMTPLEKAEKVECLRFLEHGVSMRMIIANYMGVEVDTPEDIHRAEAFMEKMGWR